MAHLLGTAHCSEPKDRNRELAISRQRNTDTCLMCRGFTAGACMVAVTSPASGRKGQGRHTCRCSFTTCGRRILSWAIWSPRPPAPRGEQSLGRTTWHHQQFRMLVIFARSGEAAVFGVRLWWTSGLLSTAGQVRRSGGRDGNEVCAGSDDPAADSADGAGEQLRGTTAMWVRDRLDGLFTDEDFADWYPSDRRRGLSPAQLALVSVLQYAENLTDRQAAEAVRCQLDWKYCLGLELDDPGFGHSVLSEFRDRMTDGARADRLLAAMVDRLVAAGLVKRRGRLRTDSAHVLAAVSWSPRPCAGPWRNLPFTPRAGWPGWSHRSGPTVPAGRCATTGCPGAGRRCSPRCCRSAPTACTSCTFPSAPGRRDPGELPWLGIQLAARILAEIGDDHTRFADSRGLKAYAGSSPITRASGKKSAITRRWVKNDRLNHAGCLWAFAFRASTGANAHHRRRREHGDWHAAAQPPLRLPAPLALIPLAHDPLPFKATCLFLAEFGSGFGVMLLDIAGASLTAALIPDTLRSRVAGASRLSTTASAPSGHWQEGWLGATVGLRPTCGSRPSAHCSAWPPVLILLCPTISRGSRTLTEAAEQPVHQAPGNRMLGAMPKLARRESRAMSWSSGGRLLIAGRSPVRDEFAGP